MINEAFSKFMNERFIAWEADRGGRGTVSDFADALECYQGDVSHWLKGRRAPGVKVIQKLAANPIIGMGIWTALGYGRVVTDPLEIRTLAALSTLPRPLQERFVQEAERLAQNPNAGTGGDNNIFIPVINGGMA